MMEIPYLFHKAGSGSTVYRERTRKQILKRSTH